MNTIIAGYIQQKIVLQKNILAFINDDVNNEKLFNEIIEVIENQNIYQSRYEIKALFHLIIKISNNHCRSPSFFFKLEKIIFFFKDEIKQLFTNDEIFNIFKSNKRIMLYLIEEKILIPDKSVADKIMNDKYQKRNYLMYFFNEFKHLVDYNLKFMFERQFNDLFDNNIHTFEEKRKKGENDNIVSIMIQNDDVKEFIKYVNQTNMPLSSKIKKSIFETNSFLLKNEPELIEYSAFYGSIQIFRYLYINGAKLNPFLWKYAIHGRNAEIIHLLEEYKVRPYNFTNILLESIKCHHHEISVYIKSVLMEDKISDYTPIFSQSLKSYNYEYFSDNIFNNTILKDLCENDYFYIVETLLKTGNMTLQSNEAYKSASSKNNDDIIQILLQYRGLEAQSFENCTNLDHITIPPFITAIGSGSFRECTNLKHIIIPTSVKTVGQFAFQDCTSLKEITIPDSVTSLNDTTFSGCKNLEHITIPNMIINIGNNTFWGCSSLTQIVIPQTVKSIGDWAFCECTSIEKVTLPYQIVSIGNFSFWGCSSLKQFLIPSSLKTIGNYALAGCTSLKEISIPSSVKTFGNSVFERCTSLEKVTFGDSVPTIGESGFLGCKSLTKITIPPLVTSIKDFAFWGCKSLCSINIPSSVRSIGKNVFWGCSSLDGVELPSRLEIIDECSFYECSSLTKIQIPPNVKSIGKSAFSECTSLKNIYYSSLTKINENAFENCTVQKHVYSRV